VGAARGLALDGTPSFLWGDPLVFLLIGEKWNQLIVYVFVYVYIVYQFKI
jgi:hypothetical protein